MGPEGSVREGTRSVIRKEKRVRISSEVRGGIKGMGEDIGIGRGKNRGGDRGSGRGKGRGKGMGKEKSKGRSTGRSTGRGRVGVRNKDRDWSTGIEAGEHEQGGRWKGARAGGS